ncbi:MAG: CTP synthase [Chloroflexi bacterium]|nr:CTP synthase [Chloroflexota bacterium]
MAKFIFFTGGVVSSVGKGICAASVGRLLKSQGIRVAIQKLDPYINVDPGTMNPYQHGEVYVLEDGAETDLDLGHYERFIDENLTRASNVTTGQIYSEVISKERRGDFLGGTVQVVPHITGEIKHRIALAAKMSQAEVLIVEVGGTVGDIESLPFLEAIRQMRKDVGRDNCFYIHVTFLPHIGSTGELKTKPTQHSVRELRSIGISADAIIARSDFPVDEDLISKIALFGDVDKEAVIPLVTSRNIYEVPLTLEQLGLGRLIGRRLRLPETEADLSDWRIMNERINRSTAPVRIGLVGKYIELQDAYLSVREALRHAAWFHEHDVTIEWIDSEDLERGRNFEVLDQLDGLLVPGGFGSRGIEGKILAAKYAREHKLPYLGLCLGMQIMVIELARHILKSDEPSSTEFDPGTDYPIIDLLPEQRGIVEMGGTMRLGAYPCHVLPGTKAWEAYGERVIFERRRHRFEVNNRYLEMLQAEGLVISGTSPDGNLIEIAEIQDHPWMLGSQFHPEFKSRPNRPHPLFREFLHAIVARSNAQQYLPETQVTEEFQEG